MKYSIQHIAEIIQAEARITSDHFISDLVTDSRKMIDASQTLFFALSTERRDAHQFIPELYSRGVRNFVVTSPVDNEAYEGANFLLVGNALHALQLLAAHHRSRFSIPVIGITGSNGKTIVKEWLYYLLQEDYHIVRSPKSYNSQIGVPLSVWQMNNDHTLAIFEAGISEPHEMERLERVIRPQIGILTNIGTAHNTGFSTMQQKAIEKAILFREASSLVCRSEDLRQYSLQPYLPADLFIADSSHESVGWLSIQRVDKSINATTITATCNARTLAVTIPFTDDAAVENAISCWSIMILLDVQHDVIMQRMKNLPPVSMRLELKKGIHGCTIINDSYSADTSSLAIALDFMSQQRTLGTRTAILSDFPSTGKMPAVLYDEIKIALEKHGIRKLIAIGPGMTKALQQAGDNTAIEYHFFDTTEDFLQHYRFSQFRDELILVKGARSFAFERIVQVLEQKAHQTLLEINLNAVVHNLKAYQSRLHSSTRIMAMVKAFAYGSGGAEIAGVLQFHKVDWLGVAYADEGVELRKAGITLPVMVMNPEAAAFDAIIEHRLEPEIYSMSLLESFDQFVKQEGFDQYPVHIEIETGMNRLGIPVDNITELANRLATSSLKVRTVFSHFAASEEEEQEAFTHYQFELFSEAATELEALLGYPVVKHIANSAGAAKYPAMQMDMVRLGIGLYGVDNTDHSPLELQTVATLRSTIAQLKRIRKGESVSYNRRGVVLRDSLIATIRIGYADGYPRRLGNGVGKVWLHGQLVPVIGTVCMDMFMIDVTDLHEVREGDDVIIFGEKLPVQQVAAWAGTIPYEIMTGISQRVKRVYYEE